MSSTGSRAKRSVFLDPAGFLALVNPHDIYHQAARDVWSRLTKERWRTFTSNFVIAETHALFLARLGYAGAAAFLREMEQSSTAVVRVSIDDEKQARQVVYRYKDKDFSLTDATSFAVIERLGISYAFTFDSHFSQYGLQVMPSP